MYFLELRKLWFSGFSSFRVIIGLNIIPKGNNYIRTVLLNGLRFYATFVLGITIILRLQLVLLQIVCSHVVILYFFCPVLRVTVYHNLATMNITLKLKNVKKKLVCQRLQLLRLFY